MPDLRTRPRERGAARPDDGRYRLRDADRLHPRQFPHLVHRRPGHRILRLRGRLGRSLSGAFPRRRQPRQGYVLELFPAAGALLDGRLAGLAPDSEEPPRPGLPAERYRLPLPDFDTVPAQIERAVTTYAPHLWLGTYQREWRPIG